MKVFDFDNTLYRGESSLDFFLFCLRRKPSLAKHLPEVIFNLIRYKAGYVGIDTVYAFGKKMMAVFFENRAYADELIVEFCGKYEKKLKPDMMRRVSAEDAVISASPDFLLRGFGERIKAKTLLCTTTEGDRITFLCYGKNKVRAFEERFRDVEIEEFYTDSINDRPMMRRAKKAYLVKGDKIKEIV